MIYVTQYRYMNSSETFSCKTNLTINDDIMRFRIYLFLVRVMCSQLGLNMAAISRFYENGTQAVLLNSDMNLINCVQITVMGQFRHKSTTAVLNDEEEEIYYRWSTTQLYHSTFTTKISEKLYTYFDN